MSTIGTFGTFTQARLGIYAAMQGLSVTGNNISNISTPGYTRQVLDQVSLHMGGADRYAAKYNVRTGNGVLVTGVSQIRDPYLDIRFRNEMASVGFTDTKLNGLNNLASILDEVADGKDENGVIHAQLNDFIDSLIELGNNAGQEQYDIIARNSAGALCSLFNDYANKLDTLHENTENELRDGIDRVNDILTSIRDLNSSIRKSEIHGDRALEQRDERNRLIDELSEYVKIDAVYSMEDIGAGQQVEKLTIRLGNANPDNTVKSDRAMLVDGVYCAQITTSKLVEATDENGQPVVGADGNPVMKLVENKEDNGELIFDGSYGLSISRLYDIKNRQWSEYVDTKVEKAGQKGSPAVTAEYSMSVTSRMWKDGDTFNIGTTTYTIKDDKSGNITSDDANDSAKFAAFLAGEITLTGYTITADGNKLIFKADTAGAIGGTGPAAEPGAITFTPGTGIQGTVTLGKLITVTKGEDEVPEKLPTAVDYPDYPKGSTIRGDSNGDGTYTATEVTYTTAKDGTIYMVETRKKMSELLALDDNDMNNGGRLQAYRELLTEEGEFASQDDIQMDENAASKRGIPYYQKSLDLLAQTFAKHLNELNTVYVVGDNDCYLPGGDNSLLEEGIWPQGAENMSREALEKALAESIEAKYPDPTPAGEAWRKAHLQNTLNLLGTGTVSDFLKEHADVVGLFSNSNDSDDMTGITAGNISISHSWYTGATHIVTTTDHPLEGTGSVSQTTANENVNHMISLVDRDLVYDPRDLNGAPTGDVAASSHLFEGSFQEMLNNMCTVLGGDQSSATVTLNDYYNSAVELDTSRDGVSGVDLNDEAMNMMEYQKAYSAACRLMTTIDSMLEKLINGTAM